MRDKIRTAYLLRRDIEGDGTKIDFTISVNARDDEEDAGTAGAAFEQATETENDGPFVFLHHLAASISNSQQNEKLINEREYNRLDIQH